MNRTVKEAWLGELRSKRYNWWVGYQSCMKLPTGEYAFSPLGILLNVFTLETNNGEFVELYRDRSQACSLHYQVDGPDEEPSAGLVPEPVLEWAGLSEDEIYQVKRATFLQGSHEAVANWVEKNL